MKNYQSVEIKKIVRDDSTQARAETSDEVAGEYALALQAGCELPPPVLFHDGKYYWPGDGHHTIRAHEIAGQKQVVSEIRSGAKRDALLYAVGANANHGLRRSNADKRKSVTILLDDSEWGKWSNRRIAEQCAVDEGLVRKVKRERKLPADCPHPIHEVSDLPAEQLAAFRSLPADEQQTLLDSVQADGEQEAEDKQALLRKRIEGHIAALRGRHAEIEDIAKKADKSLERYESVVFSSKTWV